MKNKVQQQKNKAEKSEFKKLAEDICDVKAD